MGRGRLVMAYGAEDAYRRRLALAFILVGVGLIAVGWGLVTDHQQRMEEAAVSRTASDPDRSTRLVAAIQHLTFALIMIVVIFAVGILALRRWSRRFRESLLRRPSSPTSSEDVWSMHRLPEPPGADDTS